jgi:hypothetical protein
VAAAPPIAEAWVLFPPDLVKAVEETYVGLDFGGEIVIVGLWILLGIEPEYTESEFYC